MSDSGRAHYRPASFDQRSRSNGSYAFLNHSPITLPNNLPPSVDDKPLARQKRRRTSPDDQAILEAAYDRDYKPDKAARLELVEQVGLGEKEVQIWFQNRRQTSRRKSRPLLPHEIAQYHLAKSADRSEVLDPDICVDGNAVGFEPHSMSTSLDTAESLRGPKVPNSAEILNDTLTSTCIPQGVTESDRSAPSSITSAHTTFNTHDTEVMASSAPRACDIADRESGPALHHDAASSSEQSKVYRSSPSHAWPPLRKSASFVGLSLTADGNATITTKDGTSPSPPRPQQGPVVGLGVTGPQREPSTYSDLDKVESQCKPSQRTLSGRSRDSRAWQFWCDKDARGELESKAEKDASGSAADAIDLLRSNSGRRVLSTLYSKRNSTIARLSPSIKGSKLAPSLRRSGTAFGRLQHKVTTGAAVVSKPTPRLKTFKSASPILIPGNDSDKENWSPEGHTSSEQRTSAQRTSLDQPLGPYHPTTVARKFPEKERHIGRSRESDRGSATEDDPEVLAFMRGDQKSSSLSAEDELDCVQGLLSLSQGHWR